MAHAIAQIAVILTWSLDGRKIKPARRSFPMLSFCFTLERIRRKLCIQGNSLGIENRSICRRNVSASRPLGYKPMKLRRKSPPVIDPNPHDLTRLPKSFSSSDRSRFRKQATPVNKNLSHFSADGLVW